MGQKTTPISTRLYGNCWPDSCWYSDANPFSLFYQDFNQKQFFDAVMPPTGRKFGFRPANVVCHQFPKRSYIHIFFLRRSRRLKLRGNKRRRVFRFAKHLNKKSSRFQSKGLRMPVNKRLSALDVIAIQHLYTKTNMLWSNLVALKNYAKQLRKKAFLSQMNTSRESPRLTLAPLSLAANQIRRLNPRDQDKRAHPEFLPLPSLRNSPRQLKKTSYARAERQTTDIAIVTPSLKSSLSFGWNRGGAIAPHFVPYNTHMNELVRFTAGSNALIVPLRLSSMMVSASLLATHIRSLLQQNKRFKSICKWLFKDIKKYEAIKGVRISCSGRLNGKAIARTDLRKMGETSLHTFKKQIDYAQSMAITRHGVLGIKVWVSYSLQGKAIGSRRKLQPR